MDSNETRRLRLASKSWGMELLATPELSWQTCDTMPDHFWARRERATSVATFPVRHSLIRFIRLIGSSNWLLQATRYTVGSE